MNKKEIYFILKKDQLGLFRLPFHQDIAPTGDFIFTMELIEIFGEVKPEPDLPFQQSLIKRDSSLTKALVWGNGERLGNTAYVFG